MSGIFLKRMKGLVVPIVVMISSLVLVAGISWAEGIKDADTVTSLEYLDLIMVKAGSLSHFLETPELVEEYFLALQNYFGADKMHRSPYDKLIEQLNEYSKMFPEMAERLFSIENIGKSFEVQMLLKTLISRIPMSNLLRVRSIKVDGTQVIFLIEWPKRVLMKMFLKR